jgi:hypothetical protein
MWTSLRNGVLASCVALLFASAANASPIEYIFTGTGTGTVNGVAFSGDFSISAAADTLGITSGGGEFRNTPTSVTFIESSVNATLMDIVVLDNTASPGFIGFGSTSSPFDSEDLTGPTFETYDLSTALALTSGPLSVAPGTFNTSVGTLDFRTITALSFEATTVTAVPEPASLTIFGAGLAGLAFFRRRKCMQS